MPYTYLTETSGIGYGICQRLIDEYLTTRSLTSHLVLIPTTRSAKKSQETVDSLRRHAKHFADTSEALRARAGPGYNPRDTTQRVHIASVQLDLCQLGSVYQAADQLAHGALNAPYSGDDFVSLVDVRIPRLDSLVFNAGLGGWSGFDAVKATVNILTCGIIQATTWPAFKVSTPGSTVDPLGGGGGGAGRKDDKDGGKEARPVLGEVFCGNVFGHYVFARALLPLLNRAAGDPAPRGRIVWESSIEPRGSDLDMDDFQALRVPAAYESSKRLTDVLAITANLPSTRPYVDAYLGTGTGAGRSTRSSSSSSTAAGVTPPRIYLVHPGVVRTTLFPLNAFMFFWFGVVLYLARWLGSPWHPITAYNGAVAPVWLVLQDQSALDANQAERVKWGSSTTRSGEPRVKKTELEGWGWDGTIDDPAARYAKSNLEGKNNGRRPGAVDLTPQAREEFEVLGVECWKEMERLRAEWEARLKPQSSGTPNGKTRIR